LGKFEKSKSNTGCHFRRLFVRIFIMEQTFDTMSSLACE